MKSVCSRIGVFTTCLALAAILAPSEVKASGIIYQFDDAFSGTSPAGTGPWIDATFQDSGSGVVTLAITNVNVVAGEFISGLYFNINPNYNVNNLTITQIGGSSAVVVDSVQTGENSFKADGDGKYDILFNLSTVNGSTFTANDYLVYQISGIPTLTASDFIYQSAPAGGSGPFYAAAHVQGIPPNGSNSGWIEPSAGAMFLPIPEPSSGLMALLAGGVCLGGRLWFRRAKV